MSEDAILWISIGGVLVLAVLSIVLSNYLSARSNQRRANRMMKDMKEGKYDRNKKYFGNQGGWETDEYSDTTDAPPK
jgi:hypothetical protein